MGKTTLFDALSKVDEEHIESSLKRAENEEKSGNSLDPENGTPMRRPFFKRPVGIAVSVAAACVVIAAAVLAVLLLPPAVRKSVEEKDKSDKTVVFEDVTLKRLNGKWSLSVNDERLKEPSSMLISSSPWSFDSLDELITKIRTGDFTKSEIAWMYRVFEQDENGVILFDIDDPPGPFFPEGYTLQKINWYGSSYSAVLFDQNKTGVQLYWLPGDIDLVNNFDMKDYLDGIVAGNLHFTYGEAEIIDGKTVRIGTAENSDAVNKLSIYEPVKNVFVFEEFKYRSYTPEPAPSPVPVRDPAETPDPSGASDPGASGNAETAALEYEIYRIRVFNFAGDVKWILTSSHSDHVFSVEEILSFGFSK